MFLAQQQQQQQPDRSGARRRIGFVIVALAASDLVSIKMRLMMRGVAVPNRISILSLAVVSFAASNDFCIDI